MKNIRFAFIICISGFVSGFSQAQNAGSDVESGRAELIEKYRELTLLIVEERIEGVDQIDRIVARSDGACARRIFSMEINIRFGQDAADAKEDWRDVAANFVFFDGVDTMISSSAGLDRYIESHADGAPHPWGAYPLHSCVWPMIASWAEQGELVETPGGGWSLIIGDRNLTIEFDDQLRVQMIEHKYDMTKPDSTRWIYTGYSQPDSDPRLPSKLTRLMVFYHPDGTVSQEFRHEASLLFDLDQDRAKAMLPFRRPDGSVNLMSPDEALVRRIARESGKSLLEVVNASSCGPIDIGFKRYDPDTGDLFRDDGTLMYNLKAIQAQAEAEIKGKELKLQD